MDKIIRASNLQKALEDYDSLKGQPVLFVYTLPESPNIRTRVYCKQDVTTVTELFDLKIEGLVEEFMDEYAAGQYVIKNGYTVKYHNTNVGSVEISQGTVTLYEDQFTTALTDSFNLTDKYTFDVTITVTEMAYYIGDGTNQSLYPVVTFGVIEEVKSKIEKVYNTLDNKIDNNYNTLDAKIDNEISNLAVNFTTDNLVVNVATVNSASIDNAQVNNFDVSTLIANGSSGTDGQYLGKNNGNIEWITPPFDTNHLYVNHLTVNENASIDNLGANNVNVNGDNFTHKSFDVTSMTVISEADYNNLDWNFRNQAFYLTSPNGNMYFHGIQYAPSVPVKQGLCVEAYVDLPNMAKGMRTLTTSTLTFTSGAVTNNFVNGGAYNGGFFKSNPFNFGWDNSLSIGTQANTGNIITNANELYIIDASFMYLDCESLTDTFICNSSLISGAPANYDPMKYCTNMAGTFRGCRFFNQPVTIPNSVTSMAGTFRGCRFFNQPVTIPNSVTSMMMTFHVCGNFNQPVTIPNSVTSMMMTFSGCGNFNQPVTIPNSVTSMAGTFSECMSFNQPVTIPNSVTNMANTFSGCMSFNQPVTIPNGVINMMLTFSECDALMGSSVPIHISHEISLGDTSNYIYNCLVNGETGIPFAPSRILNDA